MFYRKIERAWRERSSLLCVGLDPDLRKMPHIFRGKKRPIFEFNRAVVDSTAKHACAFKLQFAYYGAQRAEADLEDTISYIKESYPDVPVILDAKRCDFDVSAEQYAIEAFDRYKADALTVIPYQGSDAIRPFLERADKGVIVVCKTSNAGSLDFQDLEVNGEPLYKLIAKKAAHEWNFNRNVLLVVGATFPKEMKELRRVTGDIPFLVPGLGAQGGDISSCVAMGRVPGGRGLILSASRSINYASSGDDFASAAERAAESLKDGINLSLCDP